MPYHAELANGLIAGASAISSAFVAVYTRTIMRATNEMRDAASAQARAAEATTLIQLGPVVGQRIDRFINDHRAALEQVERLIVSETSFAAAIISASIKEPVMAIELGDVRVHAMNVCEIIPDSVDGTTRGPKVFTIKLSVNPRSPRLQKLLRLRDGYGVDDLSTPRWGTSDVFVIDESFSRTVYRYLWSAIHDANEINGEAFYFSANDLLKRHLSRDWRAALAFDLAETGYRSPVQYRSYKLQGKTVVVRDHEGQFAPCAVEDPAELKALRYINSVP